jgi:hypothetical protein
MGYRFRAADYSAGVHRINHSLIIFSRTIGFPSTPFRPSRQNCATAEFGFLPAACDSGRREESGFSGTHRPQEFPRGRSAMNLRMFSGKK